MSVEKVRWGVTMLRIRDFPSREPRDIVHVIKQGKRRYREQLLSFLETPITKGSYVIQPFSRENAAVDVRFAYTHNLRSEKGTIDIFIPGHDAQGYKRVIGIWVHAWPSFLFPRKLTEEQKGFSWNAHMNGIIPDVAIICADRAILHPGSQLRTAYFMPRYEKNRTQGNHLFYTVATIEDRIRELDAKVGILP